jgi:hypothetical protein
MAVAPDSSARKREIKRDKTISFRISSIDVFRPV